MSLLDESRCDGRSAETIERTVLVDGGTGHGLLVVDRRRWDTISARLRGVGLDRRLAEGEAPESSRLLAVRAAMLTTPRSRAYLARRWEQLAARARRQHSSQVPIAWPQVDAAVGEIERLIGVLRSDRPLSAAGVAAAGLLLTLGASPAYAVARGGDLPGAIAHAISKL